MHVSIVTTIIINSKNNPHGMPTFKTEALCLVSKVTTGKMPFTVKRLANTASPCPYLARNHYALIY